MAKNVLDWIAMIILIIGGLNWGFAVFNFDLIGTLVGSWPVVVTIVDALVGLSALYAIYFLVKE